MCPDPLGSHRHLLILCLLGLCQPWASLDGSLGAVGLCVLCSRPLLGL